ncbi:hypothetical protein [Microbacterium sp. CFBP9034]|uniref:hypothetical protein n=1 Tax=Microbacterium sp. CFBP9034 TaxID=3096540 RepID=UPI002A69FB2E|nr:hypothetical protein [Microbacterium sp. CFBP9034]MDY0909624.1 hypothetical protein [Microbacterium sp. CFBP9034]
MSTPEQPANQPLTRKQMREIRNTGSTPVITAEAAAEAASAPPVPEPTPPAQEAPREAPPAPIASVPLPRAADPVFVPPAPVADASVDLGASPLTRRQARQQERIRTASVPVITPEVAAAHSGSHSSAPGTTMIESPALTRTEPVNLNSGMHDLFGLATAPAPVIAPQPAAAAPREQSEADEAPWFAQLTTDAADEQPAPIEARESDQPQKERVVSPLFGAGLLAGEPEQADLPPSFDQLLSRTTGSISVPNALILSQAPEVSPMVAPFSSTGEVLITGTLNLPEGLGSTGHARGTADGKEVDATLVDGELPAHSSPTPIAASAAISTVKTAGEVIRPPAPEKGSRLMLTLAITAGALALALVGVLILAFTTGVL